MTDENQIELHTEYDHNDGVQIRPDEINRWHREVLEKIVDNPEGKFTSIRSGNSIVFAIRDEEGISVFEVTKGYKIYNYRDKV